MRKPIPNRIRTRPMPQAVVLFVDHSLKIAKQINKALCEQNMSQRDLAKKMHKNEGNISRWLSGTYNFTLKTISKIEATLNIKIEL